MPKGCKYIYNNKTYTREEFMSLLAGGEYRNILAEYDQTPKVEAQEGREVVDTVKTFKAKSSVGGKFNVNLFADLTDEQGKTKLDKLREEGYIVDNADVFSFAWSDNVFTMVPDNKMVGDLSFGKEIVYDEKTKQPKGSKDRVVLQGNGGIYFAVKFNDDGTFWASTPQIARSIIKQVNDAIDKNGPPVYVVVSKGSNRKVLSSVDGMIATVDTIAYMVEDGDIPLSVFRNAMSSAVKTSGYTGKDLFPMNISGKDMHKSIKDLFMKAEFSSFEKRKQVVTNLIKNIFDKKSNGDLINFESLSKKLGFPLKNKEDIIDSFGKIQEEGFISEVPSQSAYAVIEIPSKLKLEDESSKDPSERRHIAYAGVMKTVDGQRVKIHMLKDRLNFLDFMTDSKGTPLSEMEERSALGKAGHGQVPFIKAGIKTKSSKGIGKFEPLPGAPKIEGVTGPDPNLVSVADNYAKKFGIPFTRQAEYVTVDVDRAKRIADEYEKMKHDPKNPKVLEAYNDLIRQTKDQYDALTEAGYEFSFFDDETDPYNENPSEAMRDLRKNKKMAVYGTYAGYGTEGITGANVEDNPMLQDTGLKWKDQNGKEQSVTANDLFRAVHDAFGHGLEGAAFRARGEENAWQAHVRLFTGPAVAAITTETRGQNSWLNYGPFGEKNRKATVKDTVFAEQKTGLLPEWVWSEGKAEAMAEAVVGGDVEATAKALKELVKRSPEAMKKLIGTDVFYRGVGDVDSEPIVYHTKNKKYASWFSRANKGSVKELNIDTSKYIDLRGLNNRTSFNKIKKLLESEGIEVPSFVNDNINSGFGNVVFYVWEVAADIVKESTNIDGIIIKENNPEAKHLGITDSYVGKRETLREVTPQSLAEAYHKAKADGSNPELVKAVEQSLKETSQAGTDMQDTGQIVPDKVDVEDKFKQYEKGYNKVQAAEGGAKKRKANEELKNILADSPSAKYIIDNMSYIYKQLEDKGLASKNDQCPI